MSRPGRPCVETRWASRPELARFRVLMHCMLPLYRSGDASAMMPPPAVGIRGVASSKYLGPTELHSH